MQWAHARAPKTVCLEVGLVKFPGGPSHSQGGTQWLTLIAGITVHVLLSPLRCADVCSLQRPDPPEVGRCTDVSVNPQ